MISLTFYVFACVISVLAYYIFKSQKGRKLPEGSRPLPGPKGKCFPTSSFNDCHTNRSHT